MTDTASREHSRTANLRGGDRIDEPALSVVLVTPDGYDTLRKTVTHHRAQTVKAQLEIIIVAPSREAPGLEEGLLQSELRARGHQLYLEPAAQTRHVNITRFSSSVSARFHGGRAFAASRARHERWSVWRRLLYIAGAPLIPVVHFQRVLGELRRCGQRELLPRVLPALLLGLVLHAGGAWVGYAVGAGNAQRKSDFEFHRDHYLSARDLAAGVMH